MRSLQKLVVVLWWYSVTCAFCKIELEVIQRYKWNAVAPMEPPLELEVTPVPLVIVHHSATQRCFTEESCKRSVKAFQDYHMNSNGWADIGYNFIIGEDGNIYEGRGWGVTGAHAYSFNRNSVGVCIIGTFSDVLPNEKALTALKSLIQFGVSAEMIDANYKLLGHQQVSSTECPGEMFMELLKSWPHWSPNPKS